MKKITALILVLLMSGMLMFSCNGNSGDTSSTNQQSQSSTTSKTPESSTDDTSNSTNDDPKLNLPNKKFDVTLNMTVQCTEEGRENNYRSFEFWSDEETADAVNVATTARSRWLEDTYGIKLKMTYTKELTDPVKDAILAIETDGTLDIIATGSLELGKVAANGYFYDYNELNSKFNGGKGWINLEAPWWDQTCISDLSLTHKTFFITGDICVSDDEATWAMFFNKDMIDQYKMKSPYKMVEDNEWTLDSMYEMAKKVTHKSGENFNFDPSTEDKWGLMVQGYDGLMFMQGCQQRMVQKNSDDIPSYRVKDEQNINAFQKISKIMLDEDVVCFADFYEGWQTAYETEAKIFTNGKALFMPNTIGRVNSPDFRTSDVKYGIVPMPKYSAEQEEYASSSTMYWMTLVAVPLSNTKNLEATCVALEALAWYGREKVTPAFYEKVLKAQRFDDPDSEKMLDLVFRQRAYDLSILFNWGDIVQLYTSSIGSKKPNLVSSFDTKEPIYQQKMDETIAAFKAID